MLVIMTFFEQQQVNAEASTVGDPLSVAPVFYGRSTFERNLIALGHLGMTRLHILTDTMADRIAQSHVYQNYARTCECYIETVDRLEGDWACKHFVQLVDEAKIPVLWIQGDVVIDESILKLVVEKQGDCFVKTYSGTMMKQLDDEPVGAGCFLRDVVFSYQVADGTTVLPVVKLTSKRIMHQAEDASVHSAGSKLQFVPIYCSCYLAFSMLSLEAEDLSARIALHRAIQQRVYDLKTSSEMLMAWLCQMDKSTLLLVTSGALSRMQKDIIDLLHDADSVHLDSSHHPEAIYYLNAQKEYVIACGDEKAIRFARSLEQEMPNTDMPHIVFITSMHALRASGEIMTDDGVALPCRPATILVDSDKKLNKGDYDLLCGHIWASSISGILSASKLPAQCWLYNVLLMHFSSASSMTTLDMINIAALVRRIEPLGSNQYLRAIAAALCANTGWPYVYALLCVCASVVVYLRREMRNIKVLGKQRGLLADALDEILIGFGVSGERELMDIMQTFLYQAGVDLNDKRFVQAVDSGLKNCEWPMDANSIFELDKTHIDRLFYTPDMYVMATKLREYGRCYEVLSNFELYARAGQVRKDVVCERIEAVRRTVMLRITDCLQQMKLPFWLIQDGYDEQVLMMPWDLEKALPVLETSMTDVCFARHVCPDSVRCSAVFAYSKDTWYESRWNINSCTPHKGIGCSIQTVVPQNCFTQIRLNIAEGLDRILLNRRDYCGLKFNNRQLALMVLLTPVSSKHIEAIRKWLIRLPEYNSKAWNKPAVCDFRQRLIYPVDLTSAQTLEIEGRILPMIGTDNAFSLPLPESPCYVCFGKNDAYTLCEPDLRKGGMTPKRALVRLAKNSLLALRRLPRRTVRLMLKEARKTKHFIRRRLLKPIYIRGKYRLMQLQGWRRKLGWFLTPAELELCKLGNLYAGKRCFLVGNGPSLKAEDLDMIIDEISFGCNFVHKIYAQTQWRPTYHFISDSSTVRTACWDIVRNQDSQRTTMIVRDFAYRKMLIKPKKAIVAPSISIYEYCVSDNFFAYHYISHATVMSMMLEAAMYMGFSEIYLIGVDATTSSDKGGNFSANYFTPQQRTQLNAMKKKVIKNYDVVARRKEIAERQRMVYAKIKEAAEARGIHIYNATRGGELEVFERVSLDDVVKNEGAKR